MVSSATADAPAAFQSRRAILAIAPAAVLGLAVCEGSFAQTYTVRNLGTLGGAESRAYGINDHGEVVGEAETALGTKHAFVWLPQPAYGLPAGMNALGTLGGDQSVAFDINNSGVIVGRADTTEPGVSRAFVWKPAIGAPADLETADGPSVAHAINDFGEIVGTARDPQGFDQAVYRFSDGTMVFFSNFAPGDATSEGLGIGYPGNSNMAGTYYDPPHAFRSGGETGLLVLEDLGSESFANGINTLNQVVGSVTSEGFEHAALWHIVALTDLGTLGGTDSAALAINDASVVVGYSDTAAEAEHAFIWRKGAMTDLNDLIPPASGWVLSAASAINQDGQIAGYGIIGGQTHAFLLDPGGGDVPAASTETLLVLGMLFPVAAAIILARHKRQT